MQILNGKFKNYSFGNINFSLFYKIKHFVLFCMTFPFSLLTLNNTQMVYIKPEANNGKLGAKAKKYQPASKFFFPQKKSIDPTSGLHRQKFLKTFIILCIRKEFVFT